MKSSGIRWLCALLLVAAPLAPEACDSSTTSTPTFDAGLFDAELPDQGPIGEGAPPQSCPPPTHGPTTHTGGSSSDPDETWTADTSPHVIPFDHTIYSTVTLEPCAEVLVAEGKSIVVRGKLVAHGAAATRVHIGAKDAGKPWATIHSSGGVVELHYTTIDGGGAPLNTAVYLAGMIDMQGDATKPTQESLLAVGVAIHGSASNGIVLREGAGFSQGSSALEISGSAAYPISVFARSVGGVPAGTYTGNAIDEILLPATSGNETMNETTTVHARGVPYRVGHATSAGDLRIDAPSGAPPVTVTIEPGVTMRFKKGGVFQVSTVSSTSAALGSLVAVGSASGPVVKFTSAEAAPAAGDWLGIRFGGIPTTTSKIDHAVVEYAGGTSTSGSGSCPDNSELNNDGAIRISGAPSSQFVTNTQITASATNGVDRGWRSDNAVIDFLPTNTFASVALCQQTYPPTAGNVCPATVPCPM